MTVPPIPPYEATKKEKLVIAAVLLAVCSFGLFAGGLRGVLLHWPLFLGLFIAHLIRELNRTKKQASTPQR